MQTPSLIVVGKIIDHFGVNGWVKVKSFTRPVEQILDYAEWHFAASESVKYPLVSARQHGKNLVAQLERIASREQAQQLIGRDILIAESLLAPVKPNEYYWTELIGLEVTNTAGIRFGVIDHLLETGANDVMAIIDTTGEVAVERLVPWIELVVVAVDRRRGAMIVDWDADF